MSDPGEDDNLKALEAFVLDDDGKLGELEAKIGRFNLFDALGIVNAEIRHSNFLAWLLDPGESHGLGALFLNAVLMDLLRHTPAGEHRLFSPIKLDGGELRGVTVRREWKSIDLLITCVDPSFVIAIENKVWSSEHSDQLGRYKKTVHETPELAKYARRQFVHLTREGDEPSEEGWTVYSYADLHRVLTKVREVSGGQMSDDVRIFLDHYLNLIGSRFMEDESVAELCKEIYKNHRRAIDLIVENATSSLPGMDEAEQAIIEHPHWEIRARKKGSIGLHLKNHMSNQYWIRDQLGKPMPWISSYLEWWNQQVRWYFHVGPCGDLKLRQKVIDALREQADLVGLKIKAKNKDQWTTVANLVVYQWKNSEPDASKVANHLKRLMDEREPLLRAAMGIVATTVASNIES